MMAGRKRKILFFSNMYPSREKISAGIFVKNEYEYLKENDKDNEYLVLALSRSFTNRINSVKKYLAFYIKSFGFNFRTKPDIIHLHYFYPLAPIAWFFKKIRGTKVVVTVHGSDLYAKMNNGLVRAFYRALLKNFDHIICVGEQLKQDFEARLKIPVSEVLSAGVDGRMFHPLNTEKQYDFIYVGSLIERKGFDIVLKILEDSGHNNYKWCIVGSGKHKFEKRLNELVLKFPASITYFKGIDQPALNELYNKARWFFFPSRNEPFGLVASESVFTGTPIICSLNGGLREQLVEGKNGFGLKDLDNPEDIKSVLTKAYHLPGNEYKVLVANCSTINNSFSLSHVCDRLQKIYESI